MCYNSCGSCGGYACGNFSSDSGHSTRSYSALESAVSYATPARSAEYSFQSQSNSPAYSFNDSRRVSYNLAATANAFGARGFGNFPDVFYGIFGLGKGYSEISSNAEKDSIDDISKHMQMKQDEQGICQGFLQDGRSKSRFIGTTNDVLEFCQEAFVTLMERELPREININILDEESFMKAGVRTSVSGKGNLLGFAVNMGGTGLSSEVFVKQNPMDVVMLTLGHEIGHVMSRRLENNITEEAKAFAFEVAWMRKIKEFNIGNLAASIRLEPTAINGVHDVALDFVLNKIKEGEEPLDLFNKISSGEIDVCC